MNKILLKNLQQEMQQINQVIDFDRAYELNFLRTKITKYKYHLECDGLSICLDLRKLNKGDILEHFNMYIFTTNMLEKFYEVFYPIALEESGEF